MATYFVDTAVGDDGNDGLSEGAGNAWATITKAMDTVAAGDIVNVKNTGTYFETATTVTVGTIAAPIRFSGYTSTVGDGGKPTISGGSTRANCIATHTLAMNYIFENFTLISATGHGLGGDDRNITCRNMTFSLNGDAGSNTGINCLYESCIFASNSVEGVEGDDSCVYAGCQFNSNGSHGLVGDACGVFFCQFRSNASTNFVALGSDQDVTAIVNCTFDGDEKDSGWGIFILTSSSLLTPFVCINNIIYDCTTGVDVNRDYGRAKISLNNLVNNNTDNYDNFETLSGEVTGAPQFTDEAGGDYSLAAGSPAEDAGFDLDSTGMDMGTFQIAADYPAVADVEDGVSYENGNLTGTFTEPGIANVRKNVQYGGGGTEFTGKLTDLGPGLAIKGSLD